MPPAPPNERTVGTPTEPINPGGPLAGRVALVTGAARRLGRAISLELARGGAQVVVHYNHSKSEAQALVAQLGAGAFAVRADLRSGEETASLFAATRARAGRVDILVNNASTYARTPFATLTDAAWEEQLLINLTAPQRCMRHAVQAGAQSIVNLVDIAAFQPWREYSAYGTAKAGLLHLTRVLSRELAPRVRVNAVAPGVALFPDEFSEADKASLLRRIPLQRAGTPEDVARAVRYLLSEPYLTGVCLPVDGGLGLR